MKYTLGFITALCITVLSAAFLHAQNPSASVPAPPGPVTVGDAIRMTRLGDWRYYWGASADGRVAQFSPDGAKFVVVLRKGNLDNNTNEFSLLLWNTADAFKNVPPEILLTMASSSNHDAIDSVSWLSDNETLVFAGENPGELHQVYAFNIKQRALVRITDHRTNVRSFSITPDGKNVAFTAEEPADTLWNDAAKKNGILVTKQFLADLVAGRRVHSETLEGQLFFGSRIGERRMKVTGKIPRWYDTPFVSPDGKYVVIATYVAKTPNAWNEYTDSFLRVRERQGIQEVYELVSTATGDTRVLLDSPIGPYLSEVAWSPDSQCVVLSSVYLPLADTTAQERQQRRSKTFSVEVSVPDGKITKISDQDLKVLGWRHSNQLVFEARNRSGQPLPGAKLFFRKIEGGWQNVKNPQADAAWPEIVLDEDMQTAPKIFAVGDKPDRRNLLLDLNPQFKELEFGKVEEVTWKGSDGHEVNGGIYYPPHYVVGKKYPLVIQTHGWNPKKFWIDGEFTTAFAAQPLAGRNILVLQANQVWYGPDFDTPKEVDREVATLEGAVDYLDHRELIDRNRVGLIGFSRTCLFVKYALSHSRYRFAAASVTDGVDGSYFSHIAFVNIRHEPSPSGGVNGAEPFGDGLKSWLARSPGFNVDKVRTPLRIMALNPLSVLGEWEWFAALYALGKPVEFIALEDGQHALERPWERMVSQQGNVDWFDFWLNDHEDPDPTKAEQYRRWRHMRASTSNQTATESK